VRASPGDPRHDADDADGRAFAQHAGDADDGDEQRDTREAAPPAAWENVRDLPGALSISNH
jgi:hypothetical protein